MHERKKETKFCNKLSMQVNVVELHRTTWEKYNFYKSHKL